MIRFLTASGFAICLSFVGTLDLSAQGDFFWSADGLGAVGVNENFALELEVGGKHSLFLFFTTNGPLMTNINKVAGFDISTSEPGVIEFDAAETLEFAVSISGTQIGTRWDDAGAGYGGGFSGPASEVTADSINGLNAFTIGNYGMIEQNTAGDPFLDEGYDMDGDAFLFARIDFTVVGKGSVELTTVPGVLGIINGSLNLSDDITIAGVSIDAGTSFLLGDINGDVIVNTVDIFPFVNLIVGEIYQPEGDFNKDGVVGVLDVHPFVQLLISL